MIKYAEFAKLSSKTRSISDQKALQNIQGLPAVAGSTLVNTPIIQNRPATSLVELAKRDQQENYYYQNTLNALRKQYHLDDPNARASLASDIQDVALKTSAYYNKYHHTDHITLDDKDWEEIAVTYKALEATKGQEAAIHYLNGRIRDNVSDNQSIFSKQWLGYAGMGAATVGALVAFAGAFKGAWDYAVGNYKDNEHLSGIENFLNSVIDNEVTRYGDDIIRYGSFTPSGIEEAKGYATPYEDGISQLDITQTQGQVEGTDSFFDQIFNVNTIPTAIQQQGFTVASMLAGYGEAKIAGLAFKGLKGATMAAKSAELIKTLDTTRKVLTGIQKAENFTSKFIIPGMTGTAEGLIEGLGTKQQAFQEGAAAVQQAHAQAVSDRVQSILANSSSTIDKETGKITYLDKKGNPINVQELYNQVWKELEPEYKEALEQVDFAASRAGVNNFFMNSAINGLINSTLKAGLQAPGVQRSLQNSRIFKWAQPKGTFDITGAGSDISVASKFGLGKQIWQIAKEPIGEFGEEYIQSLTDAFARGGAESNIHQFIQNKYSGDGSAVVGDTFAGEFGSAWSALADSATSQKSLKSGIFGALSSVLGSPSLGRRAVTSDGGKTYFGRGLNAKGEKESNMEWLSRITPWRSGALSAYKESMREKDEMQEQAQQLQDWLRDPTNKSKFDGLVGTATWARGMETAASANDEFGYRNSLLGKTINDAFMLEKLKGTQYYDTVLNQLTEIANLEEGSDKANQYVKELRENVDSGFGDNSSDESIIKSIKSNANRMLNTISKIQEESNNIEQLLGDVDEDTKQALIFGQLNLDDWNERSKQLTTDINKATVNINNSVDDSNDLTKSQQKVLAKYGTFNNAHKQSFKIQETTASLEEDIKNLEKRKANLSDKEKAILKDKKARVNSLKKELDFISSMGDVKESQTTLSEQEIMALDPISRANMLIKGSRKLYTSTHTDNQGEEVSETRAYYSPQQQAVIDNLIQQGTAIDRNFLNKVIDHGRVENSKKAFMEQYNAILTDPDSFNHFVQRAKQQAADVLTKKRYELLENTEDYTKFSNEMDKILTGNSNREQAMIVRGLENSGNENYKRYKATQQTTEELFNKLVNEDKFNDLDGNTADMFAHTVTYLNNQGVDLQDANAVTEALLKSDEKGNLFQQYVEKINESSPENERTVFTSIPEAIQTYKDVLSDVLKDKQELARNTRPVVPEATSVADSRPASTPDAKEPESKKKSPKEKPGIFGQLGDNSAEDGFTKDEKEGKPIEVEQKVEPVHVNNVIQKAEEEVKRLNDAGHEGVKSDVNSTTNTGNTTKTVNNKAHAPIIDNFKNNSSTEVADAAKSSLNYISNASSAYSSNAKHIASKAISDLSENEFDDIEDLKSAITRKANELESSDKEHSIQAATLLRQSIANINTTQVKEDAPKNMSIFAKAKSKSEQVNRNLGQTMNPNAGPNAGFIASINMEYVVNNYPDGPIAKFILNHGILDYLKSNKITGDTNVYFITDDKLTDEVKQDMGNKYTDASMPIIAVVEDKSGQYEIGGKHYQPIAMMPSNNMLHSAGSANMVKVRETAVNNTGVSFIDFDGKPLVTRPYGKGGFIKARSADDNYQGPNNSIQDLLTSDLLSAEQAELQGLATKDKKNHPLYNKSKKRFIKGLQVKNDGNRKSLIFRQSNLKDNGGNEVIIFTTPVGNTLGRTSGKSVIETVNNGENLTHFNSRTEGVERAIATMLKSMPETATGTSETIEEIEGMANTLSKKIGNYIFLSQNDYNYVIKATDNIDGNERIFNISLQDSEGNTIHLANFSKNYSPEAVATELLKNLLTDNGAIRTIGSREFAMWQTNYNDVNEMGSNSMAASNVNDWIEDNILEARATALTYRVSGINLNNPFKQDGTPRFTTVANSDNATVSTPVNTPTVTTSQVKTKGAIVDSETGAVVEGTPTINENEAVKTAEAKVEEIVENSRLFELTEDGKYYRNTKTGKLYSRVTSILSADETAGGRFERLTLTKEGKALKNKYEEIKNIYKETDGTYQELANKVFDLCAEIGINIKTVTPTELGAPKGYEDDFTVAGDFHLETLSIRISDRAREIAKKAETPLGQLLLHEAIHAVTTYAIVYKDNLSKEVQDAVTTIDAVYAKLKTIYGNDDFVYMDDGLYGLKNPNEMIAELANPKFREVLKKHSLFDKLVDSVKAILKNLFNVDYVHKGDTLEDNLLKSLNTLINNFNKKAFLDSNTSVLGLRWARYNLEVIPMKDDSWDELSKHVDNYTPLTLRNDEGNIKAFIEELGYKEGDIAKISPSKKKYDGFGFVRINKLQDNSITITPIDYQEAGLHLFKKAGIKQESLVPTYKENLWILPSTNIGTSVDEFVRDFFAKQKKRKTIKTPLKAEYKGKLIFAQTGAGKTSIADNKDVIDSDYLLGNILQVPASLANNAFSLLSPSAKKEASAKYRQAILDEVAKGKTVVTANLNMLDKADLIVHMEDVDDVTARTNATTRTNQYKNEEYQKESAVRIQKSLEGGKKGIALKKGQYLSDVLLTNPKFNRFNQEVSSYNSIKDAVQDFMSNFGFTFEEFSEKGYSIDYLDRVIKGFNTGDIVDGTGELIAFMMQYNGKAQSIIADLAVKAGDVKKSEIYKDGKVNSSVYKALNKEKYIKVLGRSISRELQTQFDEIKYGKPTKTKVSKINEIIDIIREFLSITLSSARVIKELSDFSKYVSYNVLADNSSMITASLRKPGDEDAGRVEKVDVYKALSDNPYELDIIQKLSDKGIALAGSTAMAAQGTVYRPVENPLHDLDFETTGNMDRHQLEETITPVIDNLTHIRSIENPDYTIETYLTLDRPYVLERNDTIKGITVIKDATTKEVLGSFVDNNLELREGVQGKLLDFFTKQNPEYAPFKYSFKGKTILMGNYKTAMKAKLEYGRLKDLFDYNRFVKNGRQYPNATTEQWNKFEEQLQILKNRFEAAGIHIVPRDVIADGTLQIADAKENIHDVNVAGTLDLLAYNDKGEFFIFDMKTLHNPNSIESKKHKWGQQTSLYQKFLENKFGIKVKGRFIIPIQVSYPNPNTVNYEQGEGNQVLINGQEFTGANPNLMETIPVDYIEPNIKWEKMTEEEKELASNIAKEAETPITEEPVEMQVKDEEVPYVDPNIGLSMGSNESSLFDDPLLNGVELPTFTGIERTTVIPTELQWDNLTEEQRKGLMSNNITQEQWETYQDDEMKHELECLG